MPVDPRMPPVTIEGGFAVLVGSHARGDSDACSDCDVLFVARDVDISCVSHIATDDSAIGPIRFDGATFLRLYDQGSLFLYHAFAEGRVLSGDQESWTTLAKLFRVKKDFRQELFEISRTTSLLATTSIFGETFLTPLVSSYTELKNACIFSLAHHGVYEFNKRSCVRLAVRDSQQAAKFEQLKTFYDYSIRSLPVALPFDPTDSSQSSELLRSVDAFVKGQLHACG